MATDATLRPGELKDVLLKEIAAADLKSLDDQEVGSVLEVKDGTARVYGLASAMSGEMLEFHSSETGDKVSGLALNLEEDNLGAVILGDYLHTIKPSFVFMIVGYVILTVLASAYALRWVKKQSY